MLLAVLILPFAHQAFSATDLKPFVKNVDQVKEGMTLMELIKSGGFLMYLLGFLSIVGLTLVINGFMTLKVAKLSPRDFAEDLVKKLGQGKIREVEKMCVSETNIIARIMMAGIDKMGKGAMFAREAMENSAKKEISGLWQNISYLSDVASIAPLVGLLGTILGMIQAFNSIAFQTAVVKPILIAGGVSKAMITTAAGLMIAIPASAFYSYFKTKVQEVTNIVEAYASDMMRMIENL
jgi:biopolymer transport protein ExbB